MEIVEQLLFEASERAGSPEGLIRLIHLLFEEVEKMDVSSPEAPRMYVTLLRAYVLVKRQLSIFNRRFNRRCEIMAVDQRLYEDTFRRLKYAIKAKREEAREYAAKSIPPEKLKELKRYAGAHMGFHMTHDLTAIPVPLKDGSYLSNPGHPRPMEPLHPRHYPGSHLPSGHSYT